MHRVPGTLQLGPCLLLLQVVWVPGAYEIPVVASAMARSGRFDAVVAIGTVVCAQSALC